MNIPKNFESQTGLNAQELKQAASSGRLDDYLNNKLSSEDAKNINNILKDKQATEKLLSSPQAKELMKKLGLK